MTTTELPIDPKEGGIHVQYLNEPEEEYEVYEVYDEPQTPASLQKLGIEETPGPIKPKRKNRRKALNPNYGYSAMPNYYPSLMNPNMMYSNPQITPIPFNRSYVPKYTPIYSAATSATRAPRSRKKSTVPSSQSNRGRPSTARRGGRGRGGRASTAVQQPQQTTRAGAKNVNVEPESAQYLSHDDIRALPNARYRKVRLANPKRVSYAEKIQEEVVDLYRGYMLKEEERLRSQIANDEKRAVDPNVSESTREKYKDDASSKDKVLDSIMKELNIDPSNKTEVNRIKSMYNYSVNSSRSDPTLTKPVQQNFTSKLENSIVRNDPLPAIENEVRTMKLF